jgi:hypothetical protein
VTVRGRLLTRSCHAYQPLYAFGALLSAFSAYLSIGFIFAARLNAAITPLIWRLDRS